jgi:hypothetical protein
VKACKRNYKKHQLNPEQIETKVFFFVVWSMENRVLNIYKIAPSEIISWENSLLATIIRCNMFPLSGDILKLLDSSDGPFDFRLCIGVYF